MAIVELARAYETGTGVVQDVTRAASLYEQAAQDRPKYTSVYSPPVRLGGSGQMLLLPNLDGGPGDAEAKYRLGRMLIDGRGVARDKARGRVLTDAAIKQGFRPTPDQRSAATSCRSRNGPPQAGPARARFTVATITE